MRKFGIENFRVFKDYQEFDFKPITLLIGPNNSGKSSVFKALKLLGGNLNFSPDTSPFPNLNTSLGTSYNYDFEEFSNDRSKPIKFKIPIRILQNTILDLELEYDSNEIKKFTLTYRGKQVLFIHYSGSYIDTPYSNSTKEIENLGVDLNEIFEILKRHVSFNVKEIKKTILKQKMDIEKNGDDFGFRTNYVETLNSVIKNLSELSETISLGMFKLENEERLIPLSSEVQTSFLKYQNEIFNTTKLREIGNVNISKAIDIFYQVSSYKSTNEITQLISYWCLLMEHLLGEKKEIIFGNMNILKTPLLKYLEEDFSNDIVFSIKRDISQLSNIEKIPTFKINTNKYFLRAEKGDSYFSRIAEAIFTYSNLEGYEFVLNYINKWLNEFGIGQAIVPKHLNNDISELFITDSLGNEVNIIDMGFGVGQILSIIATPLLYAQTWEDYADPDLEGFDYEKSYEPPFIFLEEPESNLHPNWQSKMVDLIVDIERIFGFKFLIETHSEYMVRKLQSLVHNKRIATDDLAIYYINRDIDVSNEEPKVKTMIIREDGILANSFGPGFFDEAARLTVELLSIKNYN